MLTANASEELVKLYQSDETAWLDSMADLIGRGNMSELDYDNLREFLIDMAQRDRDEILNRLIVLISHHLKYQAQPNKRTLSWRKTIAEQSRRLQIKMKGVLLNYAEDALTEAFRFAVKEAIVETGLPRSSFPATSQHSASEWVALPVPE